MDENRLFKIGEVAKMYHVSMGTLRHYEKEGLLTPEYTDENTGYRYYGVRQLEVLNTIGYLRVLDMPLSEIRDFIQNRDVELIEENCSIRNRSCRQRSGIWSSYQRSWTTGWNFFGTHLNRSWKL